MKEGYICNSKAIYYYVPPYILRECVSSGEDVSVNTVIIQRLHNFIETKHKIILSIKEC